MSTNKTKYAQKKKEQRAGTYHGTSPFFNNIPEFQYLRPLRTYAHLKPYRPNEKRDPAVLTDTEAFAQRQLTKAVNFAKNYGTSNKPTF